MDNFATDPNADSVLLRLIFIVIFLCNIPYLFFPGKSCLLSGIMELRYNVFSEKLRQEVSSKITNTPPSTDEYTAMDEELPVSDLDCFKQEKEIAVCEDTDPATYYSVCCGYLLAIVATALAIDDLTFIFGIVAAISESMLNFILPSLLVMFGPKLPLSNKMIVCLFGMTGLSYFVLSNYFNVLKISRQAS